MADASQSSISLKPSTSGVKTRKNVIVCPVFGKPSDLKVNVLPTYTDVMKFYLKIRNSMKTGKKEPTFSEISEEVIFKLEEVWKSASIPIISHARIIQILKAYHTKYMNLKKPLKGRKSNDAYETKVQNFREEANVKLFDVAACKCQITSNSEMDSTSCHCEKHRKVPAAEKRFLLDQRTVRKMGIGSVDVKETNRLTSKEKRKSKDSIRNTKDSPDSAEECNLESLPSSSTSESEDSSESELNYTVRSTLSTPSTSRDTESSHQMRTPLPSLASICDRHGLSDRTAAALASAVLQDVGVITESNFSEVIDRCKVRRERERNRSNIQLKDTTVELRGLFFDGRKDKTLVQVKKGEKYYRQTVVEEHIVLVQEPNSNYIGHVVPSSSTSQNIKQVICDFLEKHEIDTENLTAVGCDGTAVNTGIHGGVIRLLELEIGRPLQWLVCLLHGNELPLRHLFLHLDGETSGPRGFSGPIGKQLETCKTLPVVEFDVIHSVLPTIDQDILQDLSTDQKYLYDIHQAINSGQCSTDLSNRDPGKMAHSRWLTTANRILRLYVGSENPSPSLRILAEYVVKVYVPMWFHIKCKPSCVNGANHLWRTIHLSRYLPQKMKYVVDPVIQRNGFFGHPENLILGMLSDERNHIREVAIRRIQKARSSAASSGSSADRIRVFKVPPLNFAANDYIDLITWNDCAVTEPPLTAATSITDLRERICSVENEVADLEFCKFPCHTQAVERCVKLVTEASAAVPTQGMASFV